MSMINCVLSYESVMLHFEDVEIQKFCRMPVKFFNEDRKAVRLYSRTFVRNLKSNDIRLGAFDRQCIEAPAMEYYEQIEDWADHLIAHIKDIAAGNIQGKLQRNPRC